MSHFGDVASRLGLALGIGRIAATGTGRGKGRATMTAQVRFPDAGENRDDLPVMGLYGVSSRPRAGVVIATGDGRFTIELGEGEVAIHTHEGTTVHARLGAPLLLKCPHGVAIEGPALTHNGRNIGEDHRHDGVTTGGGTTGEPIG